MKHTPFYQAHLKATAKMVDFAGFALALNYGSQLKEHLSVRSDVGMFDVSHMVITDISGSEAKDFLSYLISNDVAKLERFGVGKALYSAMLTEDAGIIDDLIVYLMPTGYRIISNAATKIKVLEWMTKIGQQFQISLIQPNNLAMLAVQGPNAIAKIIALKPKIAEQIQNLTPFSSYFMDEDDEQWMIARTGYTGENGLEIILPATSALDFWQELINCGVNPCGLAARDTLRLEAGMNLYGHDMDETINPLECGMDWVVDLTTTQKRDFIGKTTYQQIKNTGTKYKQVGIILTGIGILREAQQLFVNQQMVGVITSGTYSPTLKQSIAIARIEQHYLKSKIMVKIRTDYQTIEVLKLPFVKSKSLP